MWQATMAQLQADQEVATLKQRVYCKRLPPSYDILDHSIDNIEGMLTRPILDQDKRTTIASRRLKTIAQFKYDLMVLSIVTAEAIARSHGDIIADEKKKLLDTGCASTIIEITESRRNNMIKRSHCIMKRKMSFFDDAPTSTGRAGAIVGAVL